MFFPPTPLLLMKTPTLGFSFLETGAAGDVFAYVQFDPLSELKVLCEPNNELTLGCILC